MKYSNVIDKEEINNHFYEITFHVDFTIRPGQFLMIWLPGIKEMPMSISKIDDPIKISFKAVGEGTRQLSKLERGDRIFFRGPYGNYFPEPSGKVAYVAGGTGIAALLPLIKEHPGDVYYGARTKDEIAYRDLITFISTDDGSMGSKGNVVDSFIKEGKSYDKIYVCGPEPMMKAFHDRVNRSQQGEIYYSLERLMKCGVGICDSCTINGMRVCKDGTVFNHEELSKMDEFGTVRRNESGKRIFLKL